MPRKTKTEELTKMSRRRFTEALAGLGLSAGVVNYMTRDALAEQTDDPRDEVPRRFGRSVKNPEEWKDKTPTENDSPEMEELWYTIPRSKWVRVETAQDACQKLQAQINEIEGTRHVQAYVTDQYTHQRSEKLLQVVYTTVEQETQDGKKSWSPDASFERVEKRAPYSVTGVVGEGENREEVEIEVEVIRTTKQLDCDPWGGSYYDHYYDDIPAGAQTDDCTTGPPGYHPDEGYVITSAGHCYNTGDYIYQPDTSEASNVAGSVEDYESYLDNVGPDYSDMCYAQPATGRTAHYYLASDDGDNQYDEYIAGTLSWDRITDLQDDSYLGTLEKQGATTERCAGDVLATHNATVRSIEMEANRMRGDSGGPYFEISNGYAYIAGLHSREGQDHNYSEGPFWDDQYDRFNMRFHQ